MFFKRKKLPPPPPIFQSAPVKTIICIPGNWKTRDDLILEVIDKTAGRYMAAGTILIDLAEQCHFEFEVCERDERMQQSFSVAGSVSRVDNELLEEIGRHNIVVYLVAEGGTAGKAESIARAAGAILTAGGIGIKIETAGKAFTKRQWQELLDGDIHANLYNMFVIDSITHDDGTVFSCGMHNLGLKDTIISGEETQDAIDLIRLFSYYQLLENPDIFAGQTFSATSEAPKFRILDEPNPPYKGHELLDNAFGMWRLERLDRQYIS